MRTATTKLAVEVTIGGHPYVAALYHLTTTAAFVGGLPEIEDGAVVHLAIVVDERPAVATMGRVSHDLAADVMVLVPAGVTAIGLRFREPVSESDGRFVEFVKQLVGDPPPDTAAQPDPRVSKPTLRFTGPLVSNLASTMNHLAAASEARTVFEGEISELDLPTLLSMLQLGRKTGRLDLERVHDRVTIDLADGVLVDARSSTLAGDPFELMLSAVGWDAGRFRLQTGAIDTRPQVKITVTQLLIEHARRADEQPPGHDD